MEQVKIYNIDLDENMKEDIYVADGSNVAFEQRTTDNKPKLSNLHNLVKNLKTLGIYNLKIICDRSLHYCIDNKESYYQLIKKEIVIESPDGTPSDILILQYALQKNAYIISNDKFRDYYKIFGKDWIKNQRISFRIIDDEIYFNKIIIKGGEKYGKKR